MKCEIELELPVNLLLQMVCLKIIARDHGTQFTKNLANNFTWKLEQCVDDVLILQ